MRRSKDLSELVELRAWRSEPKKADADLLVEPDVSPEVQDMLAVASGSLPVRVLRNRKMHSDRPRLVLQMRDGVIQISRLADNDSVQAKRIVRWDPDDEDARMDLWRSIDDLARGTTARLIVEQGSSQAREYPLALNCDLTIGRDADIKFDNRSISARHARIVGRDGEFRVVDLGSSDGVIVDGRRVGEPRPLSNGNELRLGDVTLRFDQPPLDDASLARGAPEEPHVSSLLTKTRYRIAANGAASSPAADMLLRPTGAAQPSRSICAFPKTAPKKLWTRSQLVHSLRHSQVWAASRPVFPAFDLALENPVPQSEGVRFEMNVLPFHSDAQREYAFGLDGSFACREHLWEALQQPAPRFGPDGVGILSCLRLVVGAVVFCQRMAEHLADQPDWWLRLNLDHVEGRHLAVDDDVERWHRNSLAWKALLGTADAWCELRPRALEDADVADLSVALVLEIAEVFSLTDSARTQIRSVLKDTAPTLVRETIER